MYLYFLGFIVFLEILQFLNILRYNKTLSELIATLVRGRGQMFSMTVITFILVLSYAALGNSLFGHYTPYYSTLAASLGTLTSAMLGGFDFKPVQEIAGVWGRFYLLGYLLIMIVVIMDVYVSLINEFLAETKDDPDSVEKDYEVLDYLMESILSLITGKQHSVEKTNNKTKDEDWMSVIELEDQVFDDFGQLIRDIKCDFKKCQLKEQDNCD